MQQKFVASGTDGKRSVAHRRQRWDPYVGCEARVGRTQSRQTQGRSDLLVKAQAVVAASDEDGMFVVVVGLEFVVHESSFAPLSLY